MDLRLDLIVAATVMEVELPEKEQWRVDVEKGREEREKKIRFYAEPGEEEDEPPPKKKASPLSPSKNEELLPPKKKIGRNAPCPCGSGKKFKRCCMRKQGDDLLD